MKKKFILLGILMVFLISCSPAKDEATADTKTKPEEEIHFYSPYRGEDVEESDLTKPAFAIMLDNHPDARPQAGISQGDILYEMKVEGDFTRYFAIFQQEYPDPVGPIRSARPYFVEEALGLGDIYVHWGGSEAGYREIRSTDIPNIDGIAWEGSTFYRNGEVKKFRPHNGYSNFNLLTEKAKELGYDLEKKHEGFSYDHSEKGLKIQEQMGNRLCDKAILSFSPTYKVEVDYAPDSLQYLLVREQKPVIDENNGETLQFKNVVLRVIPSRVAGPLGTLAMDNIGSGDGFYLTEGKIIPITWTKSAKDSPMKYETQEGHEVIFNPGTTYIATVNTLMDLDFQPEEEETETESSANSVEDQNQKTK